jgi:hypothetical protein
MNLLNTCYYFCILLVQGCQDNDDTSATTILLFKISYGKDLINIIYEADVPNLADRFALKHS